MTEENFLRTTRQQLDESAQALDASILSKLNQSRQNALAQKATRPWLIWVPVAATATIAAAIIASNVLLQKPGADATPQQFAYDDIELLASDADIDMLQDMDMLEAVADDAS